jgi:putative ABC transport system ATP-binding protein
MLESHPIFNKMIKTEKLTKVFRTEEIETYALDGVDIHIKEGEFVAIMGPSGCGKSTLLNILGLLDSPTEGSYQLKDTEVRSLNGKGKSRFLKEKIGFVFQSFLLIDELNVYDNVSLPLNYHKISARERRERVHQVLQRMKMGHRANHYPQQLSGGQQQRVAIARAIVTNPKLILADEPTGNLDSKNGIEVMNLLSELNREGTTIVMVTHSERDAGFAHRTINLFDGQVVPENGNDKLNSVLNVNFREYAN